MTAQMPTQSPIATSSTEITDLRVDNKHNCYVLDHETVMKDIQNTGVTKELTPGIYVIRIKEGVFDYIAGDPEPGEPIVMLWIYGGKFKNLKTNIEVEAGWSTLNGNDDTVTIDVSKDCKLCAFFFDIYKEDNPKKEDEKDYAVTVSVVKVDEHKA